MDTFTIDPRTRDISPDALGPDNRPRVLPAEFWAQTTRAERALFGHRHGVYSFPTVELVDRLREIIGNRSAIEIGAGHGVLADALGIPATDSRQQDKEPWRSQILAMGQAPVRYGPNVIEMDAATAVRHYRPDVVIGCWVTHRYDPRRHYAGGNEAGISEGAIIDRCALYVMVGHEYVHRGKPIWTRRHGIEHPPWLYSRAHHVGRDFIAAWGGGQR